GEVGGGGMGGVGGVEGEGAENHVERRELAVELRQSPVALLGHRHSRTAIPRYMCANTAGPLCWKRSSEARVNPAAATISSIGRFMLQPSITRRQIGLRRSCQRAVLGRELRPCSMNRYRPPGLRTRRISA